MTAYSRRFSRLLAHNVLFYRVEKNLTQSEVAEAAKLSLRQYQKIESGTANPTMDTLCRLAMAFKTTADELMRITKLRTSHSAETYVEEIQAKFANESVAIAIRNLEGVVLWGNQARTDLGLPAASKEHPVNLFKVLEGPAIELLRNQLTYQQRGMAMNYFNFFPHRVTREITFARISPVLVLPEVGTRPYFAACYLTAPQTDTFEKYLRFCDRLLGVH